MNVPGILMSVVMDVTTLKDLTIVLVLVDMNWMVEGEIAEVSVLLVCKLYVHTYTKNIDLL